MFIRLLVLFFFVLGNKTTVARGAVEISDGNMIGSSVDLLISCHEIYHGNTEKSKKKDDAEVLVLVGSNLEDDAPGNCLKMMVVLKTPLSVISPLQATLCVNMLHGYLDKVGTNSREYIAVKVFQEMLLSNTTEELSCVAKNYKDIDKRLVKFGTGILRGTDNNVKANTQRNGKLRRKVSSGDLEVIVCTTGYENCGAIAVTEKVTVEIEPLHIFVLAALFILNQALFIFFLLYWFCSEID